MVGGDVGPLTVVEVVDVGAGLEVVGGDEVAVAMVVGVGGGALLAPEPPPPPD